MGLMKWIFNGGKRRLRKDKQDLMATTHSTGKAPVLTVEVVEEALKLLENKGPVIISCKAKKETIALLKKELADSHGLRGSWWYGTPVYADKDLPDRVFRVTMSDGTTQDVNV